MTVPAESPKPEGAAASPTEPVQPNRAAPTAQPARPRPRESTIELLRIMAMMMIVAHHLVEKNAFNVHAQPVGVRKFLFQVVLFGGGKVGVVVFFTISAWFLLDRAQTFRACLRRVWLLERELLFWSLTLCAAFAIHDLLAPAGQGRLLTAGTVVKSLLPLTFGLWWYPTSYALFLLLLPFLAKGLRALGRDVHRTLALVVTVAWGVLGLVPATHPSDNATGVFGMCLLVVLVSYARWHAGPPRARTAWLMVAAGLAIASACWLGASLLWMRTGRLAGYATFALGDWRPAPVLIGLGMFALAERRSRLRPFRSRAVNLVAASTFGVYLVSMYPQVVTLLWRRWFDMSRFYGSPWAPLTAIVVMVAVFAACALLDLLRRALFAITVDRRPGRWFDRAADRAAARVTGRMTAWTARRAAERQEEPNH